MKSNEWLVTKEFIERSTYPDKYYLEQLGKALDNFIKNTPIPIFTTWDNVKNRVYFHIGVEKFWLKVDSDVYYTDFIKKMERWAVNYYPMYEIEYDESVSFSDSEILEQVRKAVSFEDAIGMKKIVKKCERGIIEKIFITKDEFILSINGKKEYRISGTIKIPKSLRIFLSELKEQKSNIEKKLFIFQNSEKIRDVYDKIKTHIIDYSENMLLNFIIINFPDLKEYEFVHQRSNIWLWNNYEIYIPTNSLVEKDILNYLRENGVKVL